MSTNQTEKDLERQIGIVLRIGVIIAVVVMILGFACYLINSAKTGYFHNRYPRQLAQIVSGSLHFQAGAIMMLGLFLLILTPVLRIIASIYAFTKVKDWRYVCITVAVFIILLVAMFIGQH
ncbi:DUF1634 domain-containing protein [Leuconostoc pseudomesenteroides]|jgi:uncharacterized membrane protein|uniref:DUF1634 domain-containing protein n=1 Tax=Leuconostoc TaxID=1243 RepID=UPI0011DE0A59|nr:MULTISPECIES: DUF1634 domain-containing protein [Leuconostoc]MBK0040311.1 DUF1634 domain-containing protein [Leuconostoc sp. S51]MBK0051217.1 DUF1634 domain-containing protein [Leuconostoc sp. S50]MBS0958584.1 DUF1634 domain-containing protein [Leuconostoc pseudomesenteroides]MCT4380010.1 DUF1634 domain-containing protein [Leuconostoc pseudomesenteroides]MCT4413689.1 DUF1634 domain-containing protein [Leuconostoc pseudomesenteroides]